MRDRRSTARPDAIALAACLALLAVPAAAGEAYRWKDADGRVHFSDKPPASERAEKVEINPVPPSDPGAAARAKGWQQQVEEANLQRAKREKLEKAEERARKQAEQRCLAARRSFDTFNRRRPVYGVDKDGERVYLDDDQRAAELEAARRKMKAECG